MFCKLSWMTILLLGINGGPFPQLKEVTFHQLSQSRGGRERLEEVARGPRETELCYRVRLGSLEFPLRWLGILLGGRFID